MQDGPRDQQARTSLNRGSNQTAVRSYNERLILQLVRRHGNLTKAEATRATGLSANAVSMIFRALEAMNLLLREKPLRGRVGQPSTPMRLNPEAHYFLGLKIGRKSADLVLVNFVGDIVGTKTRGYEYPTPELSLKFVATEVPSLLGAAMIAEDRVSGFGVAMPSEIWSWRDEIHAPEGAMDVWRHYDLSAAITKETGLDAKVFNDGTAACGAEVVFAKTHQAQDFIYLFVGTMIGGGVVLNGSVFFGRTGNAGGFGPFRVPGGKPGADRLIDHASLYVLERMLLDSDAGYATGLDIWTNYPKVVDRWLDLAASAIAHTIASSLSVIDFEQVIIDGSFPDDVRKRLLNKVRTNFFSMDLQGLTKPVIVEGKWGTLARAVGAAALTLDQSYSVNQNTLLRN